MSIISVNPATGEELKRFEALSKAQLEDKLNRAMQAFRAWRKTSFVERAALMQRQAELLEREKQRWGELMSTEMGKPIKQAIAEAEKCAWVCRFYAEHAEAFLADQPVETDATRSFVRHQPLGPILAIMPWNFPFWQVYRFAAPAIMAGNVGLLKHASNVPQCALAIEEIFQRSGFPEGVFQTLLISSGQAQALLADPRIKAATLTGSTAAGAQVAGAAGAQIKKTVLELGGSDPFIVLPSIDLDLAVEKAVQARIVNSGQSCIAGKRFIVHAQIADEFERRFVARMAALRVGNPLDPQTEVGPLATPAIRQGLHEQVQQTIRAGARVLTGGKPLEGPGNYYAPTVLTDIPKGSPAHNDELFGPVASLFRARDLDEAIQLANDTPFGLGASAWTTDPDEQARLINEIEAGAVFINDLVHSDPRMPFGGIKQSGYGRELDEHGIHEFVNIKTVWVMDEQPSLSQSQALSE